MKKKTKKPRVPGAAEIKAEISKLKEIKPKVQRFSGFGGDNHAAIDAQIHVLTHNTDEDEIYDLFSGSGEDQTNIRCEAIATREWMDGLTDDRPSADWVHLVK